MSSSPDPARERVATQFFQDTISGLQSALSKLDAGHLEAVVRLAADVQDAWNAGGQLLVCGNGGSASDSQHIVAELVGRFQVDRPGYRAQSLTPNSSILTAVGNDYGFDHIFSRQVEALGRTGDVLLVITTSGNSDNCILAAEAARNLGLKVHGFLGGNGGKLLGMVDSAFLAPADFTPRIQEIHIAMGHLLCQILEEWMNGARC
ncbi:MAG: SIS domain-containing protein [Gemmatimonadales bacterium]|nr:SIS domain-containing protein [Gemmatimonadales bacterium]